MSSSLAVSGYQDASLLARLRDQRAKDERTPLWKPPLVRPLVNKLSRGNTRMALNLSLSKHKLIYEILHRRSYLLLLA